MAQGVTSPMKKPFLLLPLLAACLLAAFGCSAEPVSPSPSSTPAVSSSLSVQNVRTVTVYTQGIPQQFPVNEGQGRYLAEGILEGIQTIPQPGVVSLAVDSSTISEYKRQEKCVEIEFLQPVDISLPDLLPKTNCDKLLLATQSRLLFFSQDGTYQSGPLSLEWPSPTSTQGT